MWKRLLVASVAFSLSVMGAQFAVAHHGDDTPDASRCDTWTRPSPYTHNGVNPNDNNVDQTANTDENLYVMNGGDAQGKGPRYGVAGRDFYIEAFGGGGFGAGGSQDPQHRSGEGGVVQGEVDVSNGVPMGSNIPNASFSVNSFSLDDPLDNTHYVDTAQGACVEVGGTKVDPGEVYLDTHHVSAARNGCQASNPAAGSVTATKTCIVWRTINIFAAVEGQWSVRIYNSTDCTNDATNTFAVKAGMSPTFLQDQSVGGTFKRCIKLTVGSTATGALVVTG